MVGVNKLMLLFGHVNYYYYFFFTIYIYMFEINVSIQKVLLASCSTFIFKSVCKFKPVYKNILSVLILHNLS